MVFMFASFVNCNIPYKTSNGLLQHNRVKHSNKNEFSCDICSQKCSSLSHLKKNIKEWCMKKKSVFIVILVRKGFTMKIHWRGMSEFTLMKNPFPVKCARNHIIGRITFWGTYNQAFISKKNHFYASHCESSFTYANGLQQHMKKFHPL